MYRLICVCFAVCLPLTFGQYRFDPDTANLNNIPGSSSAYREDYYNITNFRVTTISRNPPVHRLNGNIEIFQDLDESIVEHIDIYTRSSAGGSYLLFPSRSQMRYPFPEFHQRNYRQLKPLIDGFQNCSNIPELINGTRYTWPTVNAIDSKKKQHYFWPYLLFIFRTRTWWRDARSISEIPMTFGSLLNLQLVNNKICNWL